MPGNPLPPQQVPDGQQPRHRRAYIPHNFLLFLHSDFPLGTQSPPTARRRSGTQLQETASARLPPALSSTIHAPSVYVHLSSPTLSSYSLTLTILIAMIHAAQWCQPHRRWYGRGRPFRDAHAVQQPLRAVQRHRLWRCAHSLTSFP